MVVLHTKRISLNVRKLACYSPTVFIILFNAYLKFIFLRRIRQEQLSNFNFIITGFMLAKLHVHVWDEITCTLYGDRKKSICNTFFTSAKTQCLCPLPMFLGSKCKLKLQKILARIMLSEMKAWRLFLILLSSCDVVTWKAGPRRVALASEFFLSKLEQLPGCGPQHWSWGTAVF